MFSSDDEESSNDEQNPFQFNRSFEETMQTYPLNKNERINQTDIMKEFEIKLNNLIDRVEGILSQLKLINEFIEKISNQSIILEKILDIVEQISNSLKSNLTDTLNKNEIKSPPPRDNRKPKIKK